MPCPRCGSSSGPRTGWSRPKQPWALAKAQKAGERPRAGTRLDNVLGDLVEACRLVALAAAPFMPTAAPRALAQLGYDYGFAADGTPISRAAGGPALLDELVWGVHAGERAKLATPEPLFPRLETEASAPAAG